MKERKGILIQARRGGDGSRTSFAWASLEQAHQRISRHQQLPFSVQHSNQRIITLDPEIREPEKLKSPK